jgi:hypothetical protein
MIIQAFLFSILKLFIKSKNMKNLFIFFIALTAVLTLTGCQKILMLRHGIHKPKTESEESIRNYLNKKDIPPFQGLFIIKDSSSFARYISMVEHAEGLFFFYPDGHLIKIRDTGYCPGTAFQFALGLHKDSLYQIDSSMKLSDISQLVESIDRDQEIREDGCDYIVIGVWARFFGNLNRNVFDPLKELNSRDDIRVNIYLVNIDLQESWDLKSFR